MSWFRNGNHSLGYYFDLVDDEKKGYLVDDDIFLFMRDNFKRFEKTEIKRLVGEFSRFSSQISLNDFNNYFTKIEDKEKVANSNTELRNLNTLGKIHKLVNDVTTRKKTLESLSEIKCSKTVAKESTTNIKNIPSPTKSYQLVSDQDLNIGVLLTTENDESRLSSLEKNYQKEYQYTTSPPRYCKNSFFNADQEKKILAETLKEKTQNKVDDNDKEFTKRSVENSNYESVKINDNFSHKTHSKAMINIDYKKIQLSRHRINERVKEGQ